MEEEKMTSTKLTALILASIFSAITAILAQIQFQAFIVPFSGQTLAVGLTATILGSKIGALAMFCYMLLGLIGIPVFAGFESGPHVLIGPTGGILLDLLLLPTLQAKF